MGRDWGPCPDVPCLCMAERTSTPVPHDLPWPPSLLPRPMHLQCAGGRGPCWITSQCGPGAPPHTPSRLLEPIKVSESGPCSVASRYSAGGSEGAWVGSSNFPDRYFGKVQVPKVQGVGDGVLYYSLYYRSRAFILSWCPFVHKPEPLLPEGYTGGV